MHVSLVMPEEGLSTFNIVFIERAVELNRVRELLFDEESLNGQGFLI